MWAAAEGHVDVVGLLLEAGADPNKQAHVTSITTRKNADHPTGGFTALMWAARNGNDAMVRRLNAGGANLNLKNGDGATAMMIAIWNDRFDMAATLAELGADVNDGSLYVAVEMRDVVDRPVRLRRLAPSSGQSEQAHGAGSDEGAAGQGRGPEQALRRSVPLDVDAEQRPLRQHAVLPRGDHGGRRSAEAARRAQGRSRTEPGGEFSAHGRGRAARRRAGGRTRRGQSQRRPHARRWWR